MSKMQEIVATYTLLKWRKELSYEKLDNLQKCGCQIRTLDREVIWIKHYRVILRKD